MIRYICDRCGKEVRDYSCLFERTLTQVAPIEYHKIQFCENCVKKYKEEHESAQRSVDMKFLKEMGKV